MFQALKKICGRVGVIFLERTSRIKQGVVRVQDRVTRPSPASRCYTNESELLPRRRERNGRGLRSFAFDVVATYDFSGFFELAQRFVQSLKWVISRHGLVYNT